ncbi:hypothetical protein BKA93DRAFT_824861 [Sparassis latifolia]
MAVAANLFTSPPVSDPTRRMSRRYSLQHTTPSPLGRRTTFGEIKNRGSDVTADAINDHAGAGSSDANADHENRCQNTRPTEAAVLSPSCRTPTAPLRPSLIPKSPKAVCHKPAPQLLPVPQLSSSLVPSSATGRRRRSRTVVDVAPHSTPVAFASDTMNYIPPESSLSLCIPSELSHIPASSILLPTPSFLALQKTTSYSRLFRTSAMLSVGSAALWAESSLLLATPSFSALGDSESIHAVPLHECSPIHIYSVKPVSRGTIQHPAPSLDSSRSRSAATLVHAMEYSAPGPSDLIKSSLPVLDNMPCLPATDEEEGTCNSRRNNGYQNMTKEHLGFPRDFLDLLIDLEHLATKVKCLPIPRPPTVSWSDMDTALLVSPAGGSYVHPYTNSKADVTAPKSNCRSTKPESGLKVPSCRRGSLTVSPLPDGTSSPTITSPIYHDSSQYAHKPSRRLPHRSLATTQLPNPLTPHRILEAPQTSKTHPPDPKTNCGPPVPRHSLDHDVPMPSKLPAPRSSVTPRVSGIKSLFRPRHSLPSGYSETTSTKPALRSPGRPLQSSRPADSIRSSSGSAQGKHITRKFLKSEGKESFLQM